MIYRPGTAQDAARIPAAPGGFPDDRAAEMSRPSVIRHRPLDDWTATQIAWPVEDRDLAPANH
ncbi:MULTISPECIES: hypothetical protein [Amycolatopsis]|uniref:Uncharacterized protein n=1 Tax=Amycolatopsis echigonensis TaxID=2576905 RepID=A0A2N3WLN5_9PSEU|nr:MULTISPECIES: hypothetical protein [Amycolatopsis]MBB2500758.1 hypothetical protein [Amycolatopsis echigonensis]PKV94752.1 hypothetical protein ATK30_5635 [Amycolatopsis niigatensis]